LPGDLESESAQAVAAAAAPTATSVRVKTSATLMTHRPAICRPIMLRTGRAVKGKHRRPTRAPAGPGGCLIKLEQYTEGQNELRRGQRQRETNAGEGPAENAPRGVDE